MLKLKQFNINCLLLSDYTFFLYCMDDGGYLPAWKWVPSLFQWHEGSYYGSKMETNSVRIPSKRGPVTLEGVVVNPLDAMELFGTEPFNQFVHWEFDDFSQTLLAVAPVAYENVVEKKWGPDFDEWKKGRFSWKVPDEVWDEFLPDFWNRPVDESMGSEDSFREEPLYMKAFVENWFNKSVENYIERLPGASKNWKDRKPILEEAIQTGVDLSVFFDEARFMQWVGLEESDVPFTIGLQLQEPQEDGEMWKLATVLRDRKNEESLFWLMPGRDVETGRLHKKIPKKWLPYLEHVFTEQERISKIIPWLADEDVLVRYGESGADNGGNWPLHLPEKLAESYLNNEPVSLVKTEIFESDAWDFLTEASEKLLLLGIEILLPSWWEAVKNANLRLKARVGTGSGGPSFVGLNALMDFEWKVSMGNIDLSEEEFRRLIEQKRRLVNIGGRWMKLDPSFIKQMQSLMEKAEKEGMRVQDFLEQQLLYGDVDEDTETLIDEDNDPRIFSRIQIELHPKLQNFVKNLSDLEDIPDEPVPDAFQGELRPYQKKGMNWLYFLRSYGFGAVLADDMGLGKTIQLIAYLLMVKEREPDAGPALIICPTSVLGNWQRELEKFAPNLNVHLHYGPNRKKGDDFAAQITAVQDGLLEESPVDVVLTTYGLSHLDFDELSSVKFGTIVLDEAQNIKNAGTKQSRAIRKLRGAHHIALTGTPMENRLTELWSIYDFTNKGYLGSLARFQQRFVLPIEKDHEEEKIVDLRKLIKPFLLRRTKKDEEVALNLPDKLEQKEYCPLTVEQATLYEQIVKDTFDQIATLSGFERKGFVLRLLGQLKQLCNHPALYMKDYGKVSLDDLVERSTKMEKLIEIVETLMDQQESGLIFSQYIGMGDMIRSVLEHRYKIKVPFLNGSTTKQQRDTMIEDFQNGKFPILLLSLKAGGTGLNLTAANHVIHYDRWWNPAVENQATDRAYRIGQTKFVHVHKFITQGTLEEKIDAMLEKKQALNDEIIQSDQWIADLSNDELMDILKLD